eukprot:3902676-Rhodomonas_salina.1
MRETRRDAFFSPNPNFETFPANRGADRHRGQEFVVAAIQIVLPQASPMVLGSWTQAASSCHGSVLVLTRQVLRCCTTANGEVPSPFDPRTGSHGRLQ